MKKHYYLYLFGLFILLTLPLWAERKNESVQILIRQAIEASENREFEHSMNLLLQAKAQITQDTNPEQYFWILVNIGINQGDMLDYESAYDTFFEAYRLAIDRLSPRYEMTILNNIAGLYLLNGKSDKANEYYKKVYNYAKETQDSLFTGGIAINVATTAEELNNLEECDQFIRIAGQMLQNHPKELLHLESVKISSAFQKKEYEKVIEQGKELLPQFNTSIDKLIVFDILHRMIKSYIELGQYDEAINYCNMALQNNYNLEHNNTIYELAATAYSRKKDYQSACRYKDSVISTLNNIYNHHNKTFFESNKFKLELLQKEKELSDLKNRNRLKTIIFIAAILLFIVLGWTFVNEKIKHNQQKKINQLKLEQEKNYRIIIENKLKEQETQAMIEKERLNHELELKNRELMSKALFIANKNDLIETIINQLSKSKLAENDKKLREKISELKIQLNDHEEWNSFNSYFEQINQGFLNKIREKHPNLTAHEIRFLSLVYLNLNTKEMSSLLNITPEYCKKKKLTIAQKMGLESATMLYQYLAEFNQDTPKAENA